MKPIRKAWWLFVLALIATGAIGWAIYALSILADGQQ